MDLHKFGACFFVLIYWAFGLLPVAGQQADKNEIIRKAQQSYYRIGSIQFEANIQPNWTISVKGLESNPVALKLLNGLHFSMSFDSNGNVKVNHTADVAPANEAQANRFNQAYEGMEQIVIGFFQTWNLFMFRSPFPPVDGDYELQHAGSQYVLKFKEGSDDVVINMSDGDLRIVEVKVLSTTFSSSVKPQFTKTPKGYVMTAYEGNYEPAKGPGKVNLHAQIEYQEVMGLSLPRKLRFDSIYDEQPSHAELLFSQYRVNTH